MTARKSAPAKLALSDEDFDELWNKTAFDTAGDAKIVHEFFRALITREQLDHGAHWLIDCAFFCGARKRRPPRLPEQQAVENQRAELKNISAMITTIKASRFSFVLNPQADELVNMADRLPTNSALVEGITLPILESNDTKSFLPALTLLDQFPLTKAKNHAESFFADVLAGWFRKTQKKPRWDLVLEIIAVCFHGGDHRWKTAKALEESCRKYKARFKRWREAVRAWHLAAAKHRVVNLPA